MMKNLTFKKYFIHSLADPVKCIQPFIAIILEGMAPSSETPEEIETQLLLESVKLVVSVVCLTQGKFYIPGETQTLEKSRQKAIDLGLLTFISHIYLTTQD